MTDTYNQLKDELSVLNPGIKDLELNNATMNLISLCKLASQIIEEAEVNEVIDDEEQLISIENEVMLLKNQ